MKDEKGNITIKSVCNWFKSEKGKRYTFIIFYLLFFIIIFAFFIFPSKEEPQNIDSDDTSFPFSMKALEQDDYTFNYLVQINDEKYEYEGEKKGEEISLTDQNNTYIYKYEEGDLITSSDKEVKNIEYLNIYNFKRLIKNSEMISEVKFPSTNEFAYNYNLTNIAIGEILENDTKNGEVNEIIVETDSQKNVLKITIDVLDYMNSFKEDQDELYQTYKIVISYGGVYE